VFNNLCFSTNALMVTNSNRRERDCRYMKRLKSVIDAYMYLWVGEFRRRDQLREKLQIEE